MNNKNNSKKGIRKLAESGILLALGIVLSVFKLVDLPAGGSITLASMLPLIIIAYRHGVPWGLLCGTVFGIIQQLLGLNTLSYVTTWQSVVAVIFLDYVFAYTAVGLGGLFRKQKINQPLGLCLGAFVVCLVRYIFHVISGCTVWAGLSIPTEAALTYSFIYNATYMLPETIITMLVAGYLGDCIDFREERPGRIKRTVTCSSEICRIVGGALLVAGLVYDTVLVFKQVQAESGEFDFTLLSSMATWMYVSMIAVSAVAIVSFAVLLIVSVSINRRAAKKKSQ